MWVCQWNIFWYVLSLSCPNKQKQGWVLASSMCIYISLYVYNIYIYIYICIYMCIYVYMYVCISWRYARRGTEKPQVQSFKAKQFNIFC